ncbi:MAG: FHA domain-containing protein [Planctomycetota bacterium]|nr:MAG: FHA domain-containing protein [Planctomycetota bacterium]
MIGFYPVPTLIQGRPLTTLSLDHMDAGKKALFAYKEVMLTISVTVHGDNQEFPVIDEAIIGRHSSCAIRVKDPMASRKHAQFRISGSIVTLHSLGASNPLRVNGVALQEQCSLHDGDELTIGNTTLSVRIHQHPDTITETTPAVGAGSQGEDAHDSASDSQSDTQHQLSFTEQEALSQEHPCLIYASNMIPIQGTMVLGRLRSCDLQIKDPRASRQHIEVGIDGAGNPWVRDLGAANGTRLNGEQLANEQRPLQHGDRISIGRSHLMVHIPNQRAAEQTQAAPQEATANIESSASTSMGDLVGRTLAGYELQAMAGEGSLAAVYRAQQISLGRQVAVKVFRPTVRSADHEFAERLIAAARIAGRVQHDHVARVHECGDDDGFLWYSMEWVDGESLGSLIDRDGPLGLEPSLIILERICRGLQAAHAENICHFDIQPNTVLINDNGIVKLLDLGLGQVLQEGRQRFSHSMVVGNPAFMSPERCRDDSGDHRSDLYALGCLFHFMLTGSPPYQQRNPVALQKAQQEDPLPALSGDGLPATVDSLLAGMMAKNPEWRYASCQELLDEITAFKAQLPTLTVSEPPPSPAARSSQSRESPRPSARSRRTTIVNLSIAALVIIGIIVFVPGIISQQRADILEDVHTEASATRQSDNETSSTRQQRRPQAPSTQDHNPWTERWHEQRARIATASDNSHWARALFLLQEFIDDLAADGSGDEDLRQAALARRTVIISEAEAWYNEAMQSLPSDERDRIYALGRLRNLVIDRHRPDIEARYEGAVTAASNRLADARRRASQLLERGELDALPQLGQDTFEALTGTPVEDLAQQLQHLSQEASSINWQQSWAYTREQLLHIVEHAEGDPEQMIAAAAALIIEGSGDVARRAMREHRAGESSAQRARREQLFNVDAVVLQFQSAVDLTFIEVEFGEIVLSQGLRSLPDSDEPVALLCTTPIAGRNWEVALTIELPELSARHGATISIGENGGNQLMLQFEPDRMTFVGRNSDGEVRQQTSLDGDEIRLRLVVIDGVLDLYLDDQSALLGWQTPIFEEASLRLDCNVPNWALRHLHILGR